MKQHIHPVVVGPGFKSNGPRSIIDVSLRIISNLGNEAIVHDSASSCRQVWIKGDGPGSRIIDGKAFVRKQPLSLL